MQKHIHRIYFRKTQIVSKIQLVLWENKFLKNWTLFSRNPVTFGILPVLQCILQFFKYRCTYKKRRSPQVRGLLQIIDILTHCATRHYYMSLQAKIIMKICPLCKVWGNYQSVTWDIILECIVSFPNLSWQKQLWEEIPYRGSDLNLGFNTLIIIFYF